MKKIFRFLGAALAVVTAAAQAPTAHDVTVFGQKIHYLEAGSGPDVILLHGLGGDMSNWAFTTSAVARSYHVFVPDQIGFGASDKPQIDYRVGTLVDFLYGFMKKLNIAHAAIVGNSLGGWTAASFTLAHPDMVDRLVLVDAAGYSFQRLGTPAPPRERIGILNPSTLGEMRTVLDTVLFNKNMITDAFVEQSFAAHLRKGDGYTIDRFIDSILAGQDVVDGKMGGVKIPTLVVWGKQDALVPIVAGNAFAQDIPGAQTAFLDHCGHVPQMECAGPFNAALLGFLSGSTAAGK